MKYRNKKGIALSQAFGAVLTLVLVAVLVIVGIIIFVNIGLTFDATTSSQTILAETLTAVNESGATVNNASVCNFGLLSVTTLINGTGAAGVAIPTDNFTVSGGAISSLTGPFNNTAWILNGTYGYGGAACEATQDTIVQFGTYPVLIGLVGTIIFLGLVIGVLVASFVFGRRDGV